MPRYHLWKSTSCKLSCSPYVCLRRYFWDGLMGEALDDYRLRSLHLTISAIQARKLVIGWGKTFLAFVVRGVNKPSLGCPSSAHLFLAQARAWARVEPDFAARARLDRVETMFELGLELELSLQAWARAQLFFFFSSTFSAIKQQKEKEFKIRLKILNQRTQFEPKKAQKLESKF